MLLAVNLPQFPAGYQTAIQQAISQATAAWNTERSNHGKRWPIFASDPTLPHRHNILFESGFGPGVADGTCPPGNPFRHPAAATGPRSAPGQAVAYETVIYARHGCGAQEDTFAPGSLFDNQANLYNLFMHELGHALGAGHSDCASGVMNGNGNQLFNGVRKTIAPAECDSIDAFNDEYRVGGAIVGLAHGELLELGLDLAYQGQSRADSLIRLQPGDFFFRDRAPNGAAYLVRVASISNDQKLCTVAGGTGTVASQDVTTVGVGCSCLTGSGTAASSECDDPLLNQPLRRILRNDVGTLCQRIPRLCNGPRWPWWWLVSGPPAGPPGGGAPCQRETRCTPGPEVCYDLDGDGVPETCTETLNCHDSCVGGSAVALTGPAVHLASAGDQGTIEVDGWALDVDGIDGFAFYVDEQPVTLSDFQSGVYRPEACASPQAPGGANCNPHGGFSGLLDVTGLPPGPHRLQVVVLDAAPGYPAPTAVEQPFTVAAPCGDSERPTVALTAPPAGSTLSGVVTVTAEASDNVGVTQVEFFVDNHWQATDASPPYTFTWDTAAESDGPHTLRARAYDGCGNWRFCPYLPVTVDNAASSIQLTLGAPQQDATLAGTDVRLFGWAYDPSGITEVELEIDGQPAATTYGVSRPDVCDFLGIPDPDCPIGWEAFVDSTQYGNGEHGARVTATAGGGATRSEPDAALPARRFFIDNAPQPCVADADTLCLRDERFRVEVRYVDQGVARTAAARPHDDQNGLFWFFHPDNLEVAVKILGPDSAGWFWVFHGGLTDRAYTLEVYDTATGYLNTYPKAAGSYCGAMDHRAFPAAGTPPSLLGPPPIPQSYFDPAAGSDGSALIGAPCTPGATELCFEGDRFEVAVERAGVRQPAVPLTPRSGAFWFFDPGNLEVVVKVLDGTPINGHHWVFYGALSDRDYSVVVTDTATGETLRFDNPFGNYCGGADTEAF